MDFLLECIGFPPDYPLGELLERARTAGDPVPWRGDPANHLRLPLGQGIEVRFDREREALSWSIAPYYDTPHRLRVAVSSIETPPDSPFDCLLRGWVDPPVQAEECRVQDTSMLAALLWDARRLPREIQRGHVLAVSIAAFALNVDSVGPDASGRDSSVIERPHGARIEPLGGKVDPGGCVEASLHIRSVKRVENPITRCPVDVLEADAPGRPLPVLVSHWQLQRDGLATPRPGWRIEGVFLLSGRLVGGLPSTATRLGRRFG